MKTKQPVHPSYGARRLWSVHKWSITGVLLALLALILTRVLPDLFFERWYYRGLFQGIRNVYDILLSWSPLPMVYIVFAIVTVRFLRWLRQMKLGLVHQSITALGGIGWLVFLFYFLWGFNYQQISLQDRLGFDLRDVTREDIAGEFRLATEELMAAAKELPVAYTTDDVIKTLPVTDNHLRLNVENALRELGVPNNGSVRVRQLWPGGFLLRWSTAGIYIPHAFEGHIDQALLSVQKPFTIAHEMAHGYGVTDEGACNFVAWLACRQSADEWIRFGGALTYWRYAAAEMEQEAVVEALNALDPVVSRTILLIKENDRRFPDLMPRIRDAIYSTYLKRHGVKGGLRSYNYVVMMVDRYRKYKGSTH